MTRRIGWRAVTGVLRRPVCWWPAALAARRFARRGWWHRPPFVPRPDDGVWGMRMEVAYGRHDARPSPAEVRDVLRWMGAMRRWGRR